MDRPIVRQVAICQSSESAIRFLIILRDGLLAEVATGHHQRAPHVMQQNVMEWRGRQHQAQRTQPGSHIGGDATSRGLELLSARRQYDGCGWTLQKAPLRLAERSQFLGHRDIPHHHGECFVRTALALAQPAHGHLARGVTRQLIAAQALDGDNLARQKALRHLAHGLITMRQHRTLRGGQRDLRPARGAGNGLRMEPAIARIFILCPTLGAHVKAGHGGVRPVIRNGRDDGEPWPAVGAVGKGVAVAPIGWIEQLAQAIRAGGDIR